MKDSREMKVSRNRRSFRMSDDFFMILEDV